MSELEELVSLVQQKLSKLKREGTSVTREHIVAALEKAYEWEPSWQAVPRDAAMRVLVERNSVWIGEEKVLEGTDDHVPWLNASLKSDWRYWPRYRLFLASKISEATLDRLDRITDKTLGLLENPQRDGSWDRRGLIVGHVQSGKTSNYTGLVCKAADAGYKIIIVLAGMHKNLRSQTQMRLDEGFLGYETNPARQQLREIGVGLLDPDPGIRPNYVTNRADNGDFSTAVARNLGIRPDQRPWLFVVKKNKTVLTRLLEWVHSHVADTSAGGQPLVTRLPLLLIDDEADHASVDTGQQVFDDEGRPDLEHEPKAINSLIRKILRSFSRSAFMGYTATPFANIFIHEKGRTDEEGDDLFPRSFIMSLPGPSNYAGPVRIFGSTKSRGPDGEEGSAGLPLVRAVDDFADSDDEDEREGWMPLLHRNGHVPRIHGEDRLPETLQEAVLSFLIGCAIRRLRGQQREHCSMLVHVTRFNSVQQEVCRQVGDFLVEVRQRLRRGIGAAAIIERCESLWRSDFVRTTSAVNSAGPPEEQVELPEWSRVKAILGETAEDIQVRTINGTAGDVLDYTAHEGAGLKVIAIGGDKLARGLTLEGLTVSYFLRASKMYDTLMQMGRWFGYRPGYLDICRLYTTDELSSWFRHITEASEELREEFDHMAAIGGTPKDYGLRVRSHPVLMVTSRVKMRAAKKLLLSYAGDRVETTVLHRDERTLGKNIAAARRLIESLGDGVPDPSQRRPDGKKASWRGSRLWNNVPSERITAFLGDYVTHGEAWKANAPMIAEFIEKMAAQGELTEWTVALMCGDSETDVSFGAHKVKAIERKPDERAEDQDKTDRYVIRRLLSPRDEGIDLDAAQWEEALKQSRAAAANDPARGDRKAEDIEDPSGPAIRFVRGHGQPDNGIAGHPERGLLLLYPLDPKTARLQHGTAPIGVAISFPSSKLSTKVEYAVNNVYWNQEYAAGGSS